MDKSVEVVKRAWEELVVTTPNVKVTVSVLGDQAMDPVTILFPEWADNPAARRCVRLTAEVARELLRALGKTLEG